MSERREGFTGKQLNNFEKWQRQMSQKAAIMGMYPPATYVKLEWQNWVHGWSVFPEDYPRGFLTPPTHSICTIYIDGRPPSPVSRGAKS